MIAELALYAVPTTLTALLLAERSGRRRVERALETSEAARRSSDQEAQTLAGRLVISQESERHRIARDLHDNLSQKLALLCMDIDCLAAGTSAHGTRRRRLASHRTRRRHAVTLAAERTSRSVFRLTRTSLRRLTSHRQLSTVSGQRGERTRTITYLTRLILTCAWRIPEFSSEFSVSRC
jgi:signal transduction histidine kinase